MRGRRKRGGRGKVPEESIKEGNPSKRKIVMRKTREEEATRRREMLKEKKRHRKVIKEREGERGTERERYRERER